MVMSPVHQVWPKPSCKAQWKGEEDKADGGRGGKTTSGNRQAWSSPSPRGQWRTRKNGGNWLQNHLWCPNDPRGYGIDEIRENSQAKHAIPPRDLQLTMFNVQAWVILQYHTNVLLAADAILTGQDVQTVPSSPGMNLIKTFFKCWTCNYLYTSSVYA